MVIKYGPTGRFLACPGFPECRNTKPYYQKIGVKCPECGSEAVLKKTKGFKRKIERASRNGNKQY